VITRTGAIAGAEIACLAVAIVADSIKGLHNR
jgi:hypothetical protein